MAVNMDSAFEGFRLSRQHPAAIAIWAVYFVIVSAITATLSVILVGPAMERFIEASQTPSSDPTVALQNMQDIGPASLLLGVIGVLLYSVAQAAASRAVLRPDERGLGYLRFGADELRVAASLIAYWAVIFAVYVGGVLGATLLTMVGMVAGPIGAVLLGVVSFLGVLAALIFVGVRLSLAPALTVELRKIVVFGSWGRTKGQFWPLLGAYAVSWVLALLIMLLVMVIYLAVASVFEGSLTAAMTDMSQPKMSTLAGYFTPVRIIYLVFGAAMQAMMTAVTATVPAAIVADLRGPQASVFA